MVILAHFDFLEILLFAYHYKMLDMLTHGDIHQNPGPISSLFKFARWNLNSIVAHDFSRIPLLEAFAIQENLKLFAITESALKNKVPNQKIEIEGFHT